MQGKQVIKIGTRKSKLALWQAQHVASMLEKGGLTTQLIEIETKGDLVLDTSISKIGSKGVFTQELEERLYNGQINLAVHSAKDLPSMLPEGLEIIAYTEREKPHDVLLSFQPGFKLEAGARVGTSSNRRRAQLKRYFQGVVCVDMRGNLQTRIEKMQGGQCDALLLAYAGVYRMGYDSLILQSMPLEWFTPAAGQGSIAVEVATSCNKELKRQVTGLVNHPLTHIRLKAERTFLSRLGGGCSIPIFAFAEIEEDYLALRGGIISLDGKVSIALHLKGDPLYPELLGSQVAEKIVEQGGKRLLDEIKSSLSNEVER
jgi:hydroxymethylbilane synthase